MERNKRAEKIFKLLEHEMPKFPLPMSEQIEKKYHDPFKTLVATLISARSRDATTLKIENYLFKKYQDPRSMAAARLRDLEKALYPVSFYRTKAKNLIALCKTLLENFDGKVPSDLTKLLTLPGVGRKTANIVLNISLGQAAVGVDIHVWRVSNRLDLVRTPSPEKTEDAIKKSVPSSEWKNVNRYLVTHGQNVCVPVTPKCSECPLFDLCPRRGVKSYK